MPIVTVAGEHIERVELHFVIVLTAVQAVEIRDAIYEDAFPWSITNENRNS